MRIFSSILIFTILSFSAHAQDFEEKKFLHFTTKNGLSDNYVTGVQQDATGYTWISTHHGLNRFDGNLFQQFLHSENPKSITDNFIFSMQLFRGEQLTLAMSDGAEVISTKTLQSTKLEIPNEEQLKYWSNYSHYVFRDDDGNFGVSTKTGFYIFSDHGQLKKRFDYYTAKDVGQQWMMFGHRLHKLPNGDLLQQNAIGTMVYQRQQNRFEKLYEAYPALRFLDSSQKKTKDLVIVISGTEMLLMDHVNNVFDVIDIATGRIKSSPASFNINGEVGWMTNPSYIGNSMWAVNSMIGGFYILHIDTIAGTVVSSPKKYFSDHLCTSIFSDAHHRLWIGSDEGLFMEKINPTPIETFPVNAKNITSLFITNDRIFAGTNDKQILVFEKQTRKLLRSVQLPKHPVLANTIRYIYPAGKDTLWIASSGLFWLNEKNLSFGTVLPNAHSSLMPELTFFFTDKNQNTWVPTNLENYVFVFNRERQLDSLTTKLDPGFKLNSVYAIAEDKQGYLWFGGDAISKWDPLTKKTKQLIEMLPGQRNKKKGYCVFVDSKGNIWATITDDGFAKLNEDGKPQFTRPENLMADINVDATPTMLNDRIFVATKTGIGFLDLMNLKGVVFTNADGLPEKPVTIFHFASDPVDKSTWFACGDEICRLPFEAAFQSYSPPQLHISEIAVLNDTTINSPSEVVSLHHDQNNIRIAFSAINYDDPSNMRFAYRIKDKGDSSWIEAGSQPNIFLTNISPGNYKLQIKTYAYDNKWPPQEKEIDVIVKPAFWQTWWFIGLLILPVALVIYAIHKSRLNKVKEKAAIDQQLMELEMKALHAQMNPHFIFNCLNSIKEMILHDEKQHASRYLSKFAQLIRITLEESKQPMITVAECVEHLRQYLEMEKIRFEKFNYEIDVQPELPLSDIYIAPMLLQPLVENAIWHGLRNQASEKRLYIRFYKSETQLVCEIEDNGIGISQAKANQLKLKPAHRSLGIENIKQRLMMLNEKYKMNCSLMITDKSELPQKNGTGTVAVLSLSI